MRRRLGAGSVIVWAWMASAVVSAPAAAPSSDGDAAVQSYLAGNGFLNRGLYELAVAEYRKFLEEHEDHERAPLGRYGLGVALFRLSKYDDAAKELTRLARQLERSGDADEFEYAAEVKTILGQCHLRLERYRDAAEWFRGVVQNHADHGLADEAAAGEVEALYRGKSFEVAEEAAERFASRWSGSALRARVEFYWGLSLMARQEFGEAAGHFDESLRRDRDGAFSEQASLLLAQCHERDNAVERAIRQYRRIVEDDSGRFTADALFSLGLLHHRGGDLDDAGRHLDRLIEEFPKSKLIPAARVLRGRVWFDQGRFGRALDSFERAAEADSDGADSVRAEAAYWMAKCALRQGRPGDAARRLEAAVAAHADSPLLPQMRYDLGVALVQAGEDDAAVEALESFLSAFADHELTAAALQLLATIEHRQRHFERSLRHCRRFLEGYAEHDAAPRVSFVLGENLFLSGAYAEAADAYRSLLTEFPESPSVKKAKLRLGTALHRLGRLDEARDVLAGVEDVAKEDAAFRPALMMLGDIHFQRSEWEQAERYLEAYVGAGIEVASADHALLKLGLARQRQSRAEEAVEAYDRLLERFPDSPDRLQATFERGQALVMLDRTDEAAAAFRAVLDKGGASRFAPYALNHLAAIASMRGRYDEAARLYARLSESPGGGGSEAAEGMTADAMFLRAENLMGAKAFDEAEAAFRAFLDAHASHEKAAVARAQLGIALARQDRCAEAVKALRAVDPESAALSPSLRAAAIHENAWCLREEGELESAAAAYRKLIEEDLPGPLTMHALLELAGIEQGAERFDEAAALLRRLREVLSEKPEAASGELGEQCTYRLAVCAFEGGRFKEAAELFEEFVGRFEDDALLASASYYAGEALFKLGRFEAASEHLERVVKKFDDAPVYAAALLRLGECLAARQRWKASEEAFTQYLDRFADQEHWYQAQFGIGWAREHQKRYPEAISAYGKLVGRHAGPTAARAQFQIGECLFAQKKYEDAARELLKVDILYAYPEWSAAALFEAGRCFEELNQIAQARDHFKKVAEQHAETQWGRMAAQRLSTLTSGQIPGR